MMFCNILYRSLTIIYKGGEFPGEKELSSQLCCPSPVIRLGRLCVCVCVRVNVHCKKVHTTRGRVGVEWESRGSPSSLYQGGPPDKDVRRTSDRGF